MPSRTDWLLRFLAGPSGTDGLVDRIRIMKGMFLFQQEHQAPAVINYRFRPYDYGPFTTEIYSDINSLKVAGYVVGLWAENSTSERAYRVTEQGREYLATLDFDPDADETLMAVRKEVTELGFRELLRRVYKAHPESASRSVAKNVLD